MPTSSSSLAGEAHVDRLEDHLPRALLDASGDAAPEARGARGRHDRRAARRRRSRGRSPTPMLNVE